MRKEPKTFTRLKELSRQIHLDESTLMLLHWDQETYMPPGANAFRAQQITQLSEAIHQKKTARKYTSTLGKLIHLSTGTPRIKHLSASQKIALREWHYDYLRAIRLPSSFVKNFAKTTSEAAPIWVAARKQNEFSLFAPSLEKIVSLAREKAEILGYSDHPYDALLECYEPCIRRVKMKSLFSALQNRLKELLTKIRQAPPIDDTPIRQEICSNKQIEAGHLLFSLLPIDAQYSRLDLSTHPFSQSLHPHDSRITTRILPNLFPSTLFSILHETGHALYEMGLPLESWGTPLCQATSLSIHESQSRWWETLVGRSEPFWEWFYPKLQTVLPLGDLPLSTFYRALHKIEPSYTRVEADEITYCLHVIVRFELEEKLIEGSLSVYDLPDAWNQKMKEHLGIIPPTDTLGCLQDIHWSLGDFGYFPTYALGNILSTHLFHSFAQEHPDWEEKVRQGEFTFMRSWLQTHVHQWGRTYHSEELAKRITGEPLSESAYCTYLENKYQKIYGW